jgi:hypothetical protein
MMRVSQLLQIKDEVFALDVDQGAALCLENYEQKKEDARFARVVSASTIGTMRNLFGAEGE